MAGCAYRPAYSQPYKDKEEMRSLQIGAVQMLASSLAKSVPLGAKEFEVFDLLCLFDRHEERHVVIRGPLDKELLAELEPNGILGLALLDNGFKVVSANKSLEKPDDFRGLKMRIQSSKALDSEVRALGANPQVMAFSEVYQVLQTGVVEFSGCSASGHNRFVFGARVSAAVVLYPAPPKNGTNCSVAVQSYG